MLAGRERLDQHRRAVAEHLGHPAHDLGRVVAHADDRVRAHLGGVLDHDVMVDGQTVHIAMRVMPNGDGAELTFLLLQLPGMTDFEFDRDAATVMRDLEALKAIMESRPRPA